MNREFGTDTYKLLILGVKEITDENLLYGTRNSSRCSVVTYVGRKSKQEGIYVYVKLIHMDINLGKLQEMVRDREAWHAAVHGVSKNQT